MEQKPSIGRIVWYQAHGSPNGQHKSLPRAAVVTGLYHGPNSELDASQVDICVLNPSGMFNQACKYDADGGPGTWRWPPRG